MSSRPWEKMDERTLLLELSKGLSELRDQLTESSLALHDVLFENGHHQRSEARNYFRDLDNRKDSP